MCCPRNDSGKVQLNKPQSKLLSRIVDSSADKGLVRSSRDRGQASSPVRSHAPTTHAVHDGPRIKTIFAHELDPAAHAGVNDFHLCPAQIAEPTLLTARLCACRIVAPYRQRPRDSPQLLCSILMGICPHHYLSDGGLFRHVMDPMDPARVRFGVRRGWMRCLCSLVRFDPGP